MKIHFCDLCNESVPQADLDEGRAILRNGRVICSQCEHAMSSGEEIAAEGAEPAETPAPPAAESAPPPPPLAAAATAPGAPTAPITSTGAAVAVTLATIALLFAVGATAFLFDHFGGLHAEQLSSIAQVETDATADADAAEAQAFSMFEEAWAELSRSRDELGALQSDLENASAGHQQMVSDLRGDLTRIAEELAGLEEVRVELSGHGKQLNQVSGRASDLHEQILRLGDRLQELEERPIEIPVAPVASPEEPSRPDWWSHVAELRSQNSGTRWQAVTALGESGDPAVAEYLAPMLKDPDIFVRMATARVLGDLEAPIGIPSLIDALEDPEASVREAAVVALRSITQREHRFDPTAKESDRAKAVRRWRDWWDKAQDDFLAPTGG